MAGDAPDRRVIATNRKARFEYEILDTFEAGIALRGPEVKSLRAGKANLSEAYAAIRGGEVFLIGLLHRAEIARLQGRVAERGFTLVPLSIYFKGGRAKVELAVARGRRRHDKREAIRRRETDREMRRLARGRRRS
jgi:SsrA-binding protein